MNFDMNWLPHENLLTPLLDESATRHNHLCPRQLLGVRMGLLGLRLHGLLDETGENRWMNPKKRLFTFVETDGCGADGIATATNCWLVRRSLRLVDYGKMATTIIDRKTNRAVRIAPSADCRAIAKQLAPEARSRWHAYLEAYGLMTDEQLLQYQWVTLQQPLSVLLSKPGVRVNCDQCHEEIINEREILRDGQTLCISCADGGYWQPI